MDERKRFISLIAIMVGVVLITTIISITGLYRAVLHEERLRLTETAQSQARLMEATLSQIVDAQEHYEGHGETGEFALARREGDFIVFIFRHRHGAVEHPAPVAFDSDLAEPMHRALKGLPGTVIGLYYRGEPVLAVTVGTSRENAIPVSLLAGTERVGQS